MARRLATRSVHITDSWPDEQHSKEAKDLVAGLLAVADGRLNPDMTVTHSFVTSGRYRIESLLRHDCQLEGAGETKAANGFLVSGSTSI
jgi:hypothetical protein